MRLRWSALALLLASCGSPSSDDAADRYVLEGSGPELYEQVLVPVLFAPWADDLIRRAELEPGERVLDVATGTGIVARKAAVVVGPRGVVAGLDISEAMLETAARAPAPSLPEIEWTQGDALELPYADASFDVVFCQQALQFFPDRQRALAEMQRVLAPGGRVVVSVWRAPEHNPYALEFARAVAVRVGARAGGEARSPFAWDDPAGLASGLAEAGFEDVAVDAVTLDMHEPDLRRFVLNDLLAYPSTGETLASWSDREKEALIGEIQAALSRYASADGWTIPWASNVGTGSK
jgi:ubiquinone/menaquinone biosynthesis C-methylase UbiE